jgi:porphobilinogen synthase
MRDLVRETNLSVKDFVLPIFVRHGKDDCRDIASMPGQKQWTLDHLAKEIKEIASLGITTVMPFGVPEHKDNWGSDNTSENGIASKAIKTIKDACPDMMVISDMCLCDYADHGHCTIIDPKNNHMLNEPTLEYLAKASVIHAKAGTDMIAPSGMIDGMVHAIRKGLNDEGFVYTPIMSYAAKYASGFYGPFRHAAECAPQFGDRTSYQMDPGNRREALKETALDISEGADIVMVKPATLYLDIIRDVRERFDVPVAAYHVSGEYSMLKIAGDQGLLDLRRCVLESMTSIKRAGAEIILTYFAKDVAKWLN